MEIWQLLKHLHHWELYQDCEGSLWWFWQLCELQESLHHPTFHVLASFFSLLLRRSLSLAFKTSVKFILFFQPYISWLQKKKLLLEQSSMIPQIFCQKLCLFSFCSWHSNNFSKSRCNTTCLIFCSDFNNLNILALLKQV